MAEVNYTFQNGRKYGPPGVIVDAVLYKDSLSSNGMTKYTTTLWDDGVYSCNCAGWTVRRAGKERTCKHIKKSQGCGNSDMLSPEQFRASNCIAVKPVHVTKPPERQLRHIRITK